MAQTTIDGRSYALQFVGAHRPLRVAVGGAEIELPPWSWARHLRGLRSHLRVVQEGLDLDERGLSEDLLTSAAVPEPLRDALRPLALWWIHGPDVSGDGPVGEVDAQGRVRLRGDLRARLRRWTWGERLAAAQAHVHGDVGSEACEFDLVAYLEAMVEGCLVGLESTVSGEVPVLAELDASASRHLCAAVMALNHSEDEHDGVDALLAALSPELASATLRLCGVLGWTLERVLDTPAIEVERLLKLVARTTGGEPRVERRPSRVASRSRRPSVADHPDATVFTFVDGGGGS